MSRRTFARVTHAIFVRLWRWARRRHPTKRAGWVKKRYFRTTPTREWIFAARLTGPDGTVRQVRLGEAVDMPIQRHIKIQAAANPYDPAWEVYFEHRLGVHMEHTLTGRRQLLALWKEQRGVCPVCGRKITTLSGWHNHHLVWRSHGGTDGAANRVLLHPTCHPPATAKCTANDSAWRNRVRQRALGRLELLDGKRSRAVLRGGAVAMPSPYPTPRLAADALLRARALGLQCRAS